MWAQLVKMKVKPGHVDELRRIERQWEEAIGRGTDSGWSRTLLLRNAKNSDELYSLVFFESEEKARANEQTPEHQAIIAQFQRLTEREPQYVDLTPISESTR